PGGGYQGIRRKALCLNCYEIIKSLLITHQFLPTFARRLFLRAFAISFNCPGAGPGQFVLRICGPTVVPSTIAAIFRLSPPVSDPPTRHTIGKHQANDK
ncbi:MAG: hypothetical protein ACYTGS_21350, partial [Planctomycetota bacterium]